MKRKKHLPILFLAALFAIVSNGVSIYEHFCNTVKSASFSLISAPTCEMEEQQDACCAKTAVAAKTHKDCCEQKSFFKKFSYEGFTAKIFSFELNDVLNYIAEYIRIELHIPFIQDLFTGLSPPYPDYEIAQYLEPTQPELQIFIC